jgi:hypothetical protein
MYDDFDEFCTVGHTDEGHWHCRCWHDGDGCCRCKAPAMTEEQMREQGMIECD